MTVLQLISELLKLEQTKSIYLVGTQTGRFVIEPITESCDDKTVVGYVITEPETTEDTY